MLQSPSWTLSTWQSQGGQTDWWRAARPPVTFSTRNRQLKNPGPAGPQAPEYPTRATWRSPSTAPKHEPTPGSMTEAPEAPVTQVGGDRTALCSHLGETLHSTCQCWRTARHVNADRVRLSPVVVREARNIQNFFPFPQTKRKKLLKDDDAEEEDHKDVPQEEPEDRLDLSLLEKQPRKVQLFALLLRLSWATALRIASLWRTLRGPLHRCLQDISWEEVGESKPGIVEVHEGLEGDRVLHLCHHCITLLKDDISPKGTRVVLAIKSWHLPPASLRRRTRRESPEDWRARDFTAKVHQSVQKEASTNEHMAESMSSTSEKDQMTLVLFRMSKDCRPASTVTCWFKERVLVASSPSNMQKQWLWTPGHCRSFDTFFKHMPKEGTKTNCRCPQGYRTMTHHQLANDTRRQTARHFQKPPKSHRS